MSNLPGINEMAFVIRVCGCCEKSLALLGKPVTVSAIADCDVALCGHCHKAVPACEMALTECGVWFLRSSLKRLPPLAELQAVDICDELERERPRVRETV